MVFGPLQEELIAGLQQQGKRETDIEMATAYALFIDRGAEDPKEEEMEVCEIKVLDHLLTLVVHVSSSSKLARESLSQPFFFTENMFIHRPQGGQNPSWVNQT